MLGIVGRVMKRSQDPFKNHTVSTDLDRLSHDKENYPHTFLYHIRNFTITNYLRHDLRSTVPRGANDHDCPLTFTCRIYN